MLPKEEDVLSKIKNTPKYKQLQKAKRIYYYNKTKKILKYILIIGISISILFFPTQTGGAIGSWFNDFFGTMYKNIIK